MKYFSAIETTPTQFWTNFVLEPCIRPASRPDEVYKPYEL